MSLYNVVALLAVFLVSVQCLDTPDPLAVANTRFALDTYQQLSANDGNVFFSPLSLSLVLGMLYEGSQGNTRSQIESAANFATVNNLASSFQNLISVLNAPSKNYTLQTANRMYASSDHDFLSSYVKKIQDMYKSDIVSSDFRNNAEVVRQQINKWVEDKTNDKIKELLSKKSVQPNTAMVLVNALYFKGDWALKFKPESTSTKAFYINSKKSVSTDMMYQKGKFKVMANLGKRYQVLEMPYKGNAMSMHVVLPFDIEGLARIERLMTYEELQSIHQMLYNRYQTDVLVTLPKFTIKQKYEMNDLFSKMGMSDLFTAGVCDLSGIDGKRSLHVSAMLHESFIEVNEDGSEAAAATGAVIMPPAFFPPIVFKADRPFLFYIKDNRSGSVLFMGRYVQP